MEQFATENLLLIEILVDQVDFEYNVKKDLQLMSGETCVAFQFLDNMPILIGEEDFMPKKRKYVDACHSCGNVKHGKSCLFSLTPAQAEAAMQQFDVYVEVFKKTHCGVSEKILIGESMISVVNLFKQLMIEVISGEDACAKTLKDCFRLTNMASGEMVGNISVYIRMSCYGKLIVTQFQMNLADKSIEFKANEGHYLFKYNNSGCPPAPPEPCPPPPYCPPSPCSEPPTCPPPRQPYRPKSSPRCSPPPYCPPPPLRCPSPPTHCPPTPTYCPPTLQCCSSTQSCYSSPPPCCPSLSPYCSSPPACCQQPPSCSCPPATPSCCCKACCPAPPACSPCCTPPVCCLPKACCAPPPCQLCNFSLMEGGDLETYDEIETNMGESGGVKFRILGDQIVHDDYSNNYSLYEDEPQFPLPCPPPVCTCQGCCGTYCPSAGPKMAMRPNCGDGKPFTLSMKGCCQGDKTVTCQAPSFTPHPKLKPNFNEFMMPDKEYYVLRVGKRVEGSAKRNNVDLELCTPKIWPKPPPIVKENKRAQCNENDLPPGYLDKFYAET